MQKVVRIIYCLMLVLWMNSAQAAEGSLTFHDVFVGGEEGYHTYRIPPITTTQSGAVLAFAEGRVSRSDHASNDIA